MISIKELNPHNYPTSEEIDRNLLTLQGRLNKIRVQYGSPMTITSGLRSTAQQDALIAAGKSNAKASKHLYGQAADIADDGKIKPWLLANIKFCEEVGLWMEDFSATPTWVHCQIVPPKSGKRFFIP
jgi:uncharacterized protein YcbK (DUF882 family)